MRNMALQVYLKSGMVIPLIVQEQVGAEVLLRWKSADFQLRGIRTIEGRTVDSVDFAIDITDVAALLLLPVDEHRPVFKGIGQLSPTSSGR